MKQSNTSHNEILFGGILQPMIDALENRSRADGHLIGQEVVVLRKDVETIIAIDSKNNIHLLISPFPGDDLRFARLELYGLKVEEKEWSVSGSQIKKYLDLSCLTGKLPSFRRPFLRFAEDVLYEISRSEASPSDAVYSTGIRWKKFWAADNTKNFSNEWLHGIFGELIFISEMIKQSGAGIIKCWTGPSGKDHDFQTGRELAVEIKTSSEIPFVIHCNINQLDYQLFKRLYIICYKVNYSKSGRTLPEIVKDIEEVIGNDYELLDNFYERLVKAGYSRQQETLYNEFPLSCSKPSVFHVEENFPKIIEKSFIYPPDNRISNIRYTLKLTGIKELSISKIKKDLNLFIRNEHD